MTDAQAAKLIEMVETTERYLPLVPKTIHPALRYSIAKYYPALMKLAAE